MARAAMRHARKTALGRAPHPGAVESLEPEAGADRAGRSLHTLAKTPPAKPAAAEGC